MKNNLLIVGAGGHGKVVLDMAKSTGNYTEFAFLDDGKRIGEKVLDCEVIGGISKLASYKNKFSNVAIAIGNNDIRVILGESAKNMGYNLPVISHRSSVISSYASIGKGTVIMPNVIVNADTEIGDFVILNSGSIVEHDNVIASGSHISYGAILGSGVKVNERCTIDMGVIVKRNMHVLSDIMK